MLTHASIAKELGFGAINGVFRYNEDYVRKHDEVVAFLIDVLEPACEKFQEKQYGLMFDIIHRSRPLLKRRADKIAWVDFFSSLNVARLSGTVGDVIDLTLRQELFGQPRALVERQRKLEAALRELQPGEELREPRRLTEFQKLRSVAYGEMIALSGYLNERTPFSTQHGTKGEEYDSVVAVFGGGWTKYNFPGMLADFESRSALTGDKLKKFERSRNLFYVACSRARRDLVLLFTTEVTTGALTVLEDWVGAPNVIAVRYSADGAPVNLPDANY
jgi:DNA helicase-2/ATP-dependent DNA helicase PcrA